MLSRLFLLCLFSVVHVTQCLNVALSADNVQKSLVVNSTVADEFRSPLNQSNVEVLFSPDIVNAKLEFVSSVALETFVAFRHVGVMSTPGKLEEFAVAESSKTDLNANVVMLPANQPLSINIDYTCEATFHLSETWTVLYREQGSTNYQQVKFVFVKDCRAVGCADRCMLHGTCNELYGECNCEQDWYGDECQFYWKILNRVCPGDPVPMHYQIPGDHASNSDWYGIFEEGNDDVLDPFEWRYVHSLTQIYDGEADQELEIDMRYNATFPPQYNHPGTFKLLLFLEDGYDVGAEVEFEIAGYDECGYDVTPCASAADCNDNGECVEGTCECNDGWYFYDCSRGCNGDVPLPSSGELVTGPYPNLANCSWTLNIADNQQAEFVIEQLNLDLEDVMAIEKQNDDGEWVLVSEFASSIDGDAVMVAVQDAKAARMRLESNDLGVASGIVASYKVVDLPVPAVPPRELTVWEIVAIVAGVVVALALLIGCVVFAVRKAHARSEQKARDAEAAANMPAETWSAETEIKQVPKIAYDTASGDHYSTLPPGSLVSATHEGNGPLFAATRGGERCPINSSMKSSLRLQNHGKHPVDYIITLPEGLHQFTFTATPGVGTIPPSSHVDVNLAFTLLYTSKVERFLKVVFSGTDGEIYFPVTLEGEPSTRLNPELIEVYGKPIGKGAFGSVYKGRYRQTKIAVKIPSAQLMLDGDLDNSEFENEILLLEKLHNPYIVDYIGASHVPGKMAICTELLERGSVADLVRNAKTSFVLRVKFSLDAAIALSFLHENGVIYRDVKADNLLVAAVMHTAAVNCKLSDFGTATTVLHPYTPMQHSGSVGTPIYMAPEVMESQPYDCRADVYSHAMTTYELVVGKTPFSGIKHLWDIPRIVTSGLRPEIPDLMNDDLSTLINDGWLHRIEKRPKMAEVAERLQKIYKAESKSYTKAKKEGRRAEFADSRRQTMNTGSLDGLLDKANAIGHDTTSSQLMSSDPHIVPAEDMPDAHVAKDKFLNDRKASTTIVDVDEGVLRDKKKKKKKSKKTEVVQQQASESSDESDDNDGRIDEDSFQGEYSYETDDESDSESPLPAPEPEPVKKAKKSKKKSKK